MTSSLPAEAREAFSRFVTCEYTTVGARQQPITWPVTPYYSDGGPTIDVTTGLGYPKKADDAKRHPSVSLLFSDPTGSGLEQPAQVLVQGTAEVDDVDLERNADRYFRESAEKLPATKKMHPPKPIRRMFGWYYTRIYVYVRPERVLIWRHGDVGAEPEVHDAHMEEVRSGHSEEPPEEHGDPAPGATAWDERMDALGRDNDTAAVSWLGPDGFPLSTRLPIEVDPATREIRLTREPTGLPLTPGRSCLAVHRHAPDFTWQRNFQVRGNLERDARGWKLAPRKLVGGIELPEGVAGRYKSFLSRTIPYRRRAKRRLRERAR
ncbi:MAG: pyridoxamine 5'-phosphate oxidase family protein [Actinobacteria bacterium]|nr:pyridoxamine 5'-phosphate oxidase family protein [Actinomycetota bacterium]